MQPYVECDWRRPTSYWTMSPSLTKSKLSVRAWNAVYENIWQKREYGGGARSWWNRPAREFDQYATEYGMRMLTHQRESLLLHLSRLTYSPGDDAEWLTVFRDYRNMTQSEREDLVLTVFERGAREIETAPTSLSLERNLVPEATLKNLTDPDQFEQLVRAQLRPKTSDPYRVMRNAAFEKVADPAASSGGAKIPLPRGYRAFLEGIYLERHWAIADICMRMTYIIVGEDRTGPPTFTQGPVASEREQQELAAIPGAKGQEKARPGTVKDCMWCGTKESKRTRLLSECQVKHFPTHKATCGKELSKTVEVRTDHLESRNLGAAPLALFEALHSVHPRAVWGVAGSAYLPGATRDMDPILFNLPPFIENFDETLAFFRQIARNAALQNDSLALGVVTLFCRKSYPFNRDTVGCEGVDKVATKGLLAVTDDDIEKAVEQASNMIIDNPEWAIATRCFEQLDDPSNALSSGIATFLRHFALDRFAFYTLPQVGDKVSALRINGAASSDLHAFREMIVSAFLSNDRSKRLKGVCAILQIATAGIDDQFYQRSLKAFSKDLAVRVLDIALEEVRLMWESWTNDAKSNPVNPVLNRLMGLVKQTIPTFAMVSAACGLDVPIVPETASHAPGRKPLNFRPTINSDGSMTYDPFGLFSSGQLKNNLGIVIKGVNDNEDGTGPATAQVPAIEASSGKKKRNKKKKKKAKKPAVGVEDEGEADQEDEGDGGRRCRTKQTR
ncbi:hypothetical protein JCM6882_009419 [Rhodosporidiobolus microsporus]